MIATPSQASELTFLLGETPTRSKETTELYENRVALLLAKYQLGTLGNATLSGYAAWLRDRRSGMSAASFRQYRAASISIFGTILELDGLEPSVCGEVRKAIGILCSTRGTQLSPGPQIPLRTSARKQKRIDAQDWEKLAAALLASERRHVEAVILLLAAGLVTGLRPSEWIKAELFHDVEDGWKLKVQNGKSTNGRSHGPTRTLSWSSCSEEVLAVRNWLEHLETCLLRDRTRARAGWKTYYAQLRHTLYEVCQKLWPRRWRRPTFYSTRHTFAAAAKAVLTPSEVGALLGHGTDFTVLTHYARPPKGGSKLPRFILPRADPVQVLRVRQVLGERLTRATPLRMGFAQALELDRDFAEDHDAVCAEPPCDPIMSPF